MTLLRRLIASSPTTEDGIDAWTAEADEVHRTLVSEYPNVRLPVEVMHYVHDADIRVRAPEFAATQDLKLESYIRDLESGVLPHSDMTRITLGLFGKGVTLGCSTTLLWVVGFLILLGLVAVLIVRGAR